MQDEAKQAQEVMVKRTAKNSVFLDLFQNKCYLLKLYKTLHPEDTTATEDSLTDVTIENVLTDNLYNDLGFIVNNQLCPHFVGQERGAAVKDVGDGVELVGLELDFRVDA